METSADKLGALMLALALHAGLLALLFVGLWWSRPPQTLSVAGTSAETRAARTRARGPAAATTAHAQSTAGANATAAATAGASAQAGHA